MKSLTFQPINEVQAIPTGTDLLQALLAKNLNVLMACGGKGLCATCHVHIKSGMEQLTEMTPRESRTLSFITGVDQSSRLACQCRVLGDGLVVQLPEGMYIERAEDLMSMLGQRAAQNILHPINGSILIEKGKIITRTRLEQLKELNVEVESLKGS
ncbi:2Fe-2S iron-sulfur cluster-binding protein [Tuwongella immobilis]|uniref:2Fe-2S ferredoxin-type domain-containing protein n=1 Tax=Tuwongella immobilis TaxID=692036 RepID=A0A6C2YSI1_9BACT|nr:2Fe-2S iron-sulfur cluster-binding protein [Tuwongella immobilis]VIP04331.1 ferredoxin : Ferredoxin OS=Isosphaera pallida (strain ATCC 43644 / DSM 9630 / IS1B) GN=Isop_2222 PE=4 SV=1: Fer2 [Tuwongella immobilis]VTS06024.1 ferredoxin : Ferredoxin OS=Isosphaera pallida (strain ATCC 43644 / DSM 9630 / IS1B) GN=Isop_2222 PE=4 SV=1: Fer2 [Tuwongella immobilis]